jgi:hypothetical protein
MKFFQTLAMAFSIAACAQVTASQAGCLILRGSSNSGEVMASVEGNKIIRGNVSSAEVVANGSDRTPVELLFATGALLNQ